MSMIKGMMKLPDDLYREPTTGARYNDSAIPLHRGNPLLEALPQVVDDAMFYRQLAQLPKYSESEREISQRHIRKTLLQNLFLFFQPLPRHRELATDIYDLICTGYLTRNPLDPLQPATILQRADEMDGTLIRPVASLRSGLLTGLPGTGKSQSLSRMLSLIPQVIHHTDFRGKPFVHDQVTWLKLECPGDASARALCLAFFQQMDWLLGTNYLENYEGSHAATSTMVPALGRVALVHSLGLLVIDEVQHLCRSETPQGQPISQRDKQKLINFIVQVVNTLGVPVLLVGNSSFLDFLGSSAHLVRRGTGLQNSHWMRFQENEEWKLFTDALWQYQYIKTPAKLTENEELRSVFYDETQGLADYAVKLFEGIQKFLIDEGGEEVITPEVIRHVAKIKLAPSIPLLTALREHDYDFLRNTKTVHPIDIFGADSLEALKGWPKNRLPSFACKPPQSAASAAQKSPPITLPGTKRKKRKDSDGSESTDEAKAA